MNNKGIRGNMPVATCITRKYLRPNASDKRPTKPMYGPHEGGARGRGAVDLLVDRTHT